MRLLLHQRRRSLGLFQRRLSLNIFWQQHCNLLYHLQRRLRLSSTNCPVGGGQCDGAVGGGQGASAYVAPAPQPPSLPASIVACAVGKGADGGAVVTGGGCNAAAGGGSGDSAAERGVPLVEEKV